MIDRQTFMTGMPAVVALPRACLAQQAGKTRSRPWMMRSSGKIALRGSVVG